MSEEICKYHYTFSGTHNIATIYEDDMIICKDILIEEETLDKIIDKLNNLSEENEKLKQELNECANHKLYSRRKLEKENEQLKEENIGLKNLRKYCAEWIGVNEENLYDVVR